MSRIDEALNRASGAPVDVRDPSELKDAFRRRSDPSSLEWYPRESGPTLDRPVRSELSSSKPIAAPRLGRAWQLATALEGKLVTSSQTARVAVEQYRRLAATLHGLQVERGLKTLLVTSTVPEEGKTLTVANIALTLSESYKRRVLLIDADLRRPSIHQVFGLPNVTGLSDGLRSDHGPLPVLEVSSCLSVVTAGKPDANPTARLTSDRMRALVEEAASAFDWVLLDAPPVGLMPDASLLQRLTSAVVYVIAAGSTPYSLIDRAVADLGRECIIGTVLNRVDEDKLPSTGYDRYYGEASSDG
jgi:capsular exopolysaccharide synthesis family protein